VVANRAQVLKGFEIGEGEQFIKANDDVNKSQSSNDTFPRNAHRCYKSVVEITILRSWKLRDTLHAKATEFKT
jgi:fumarate hydratase class II